MAKKRRSLLQNRVGENPISAEEASEFLKGISKFATRLKEVGVLLTKEERKRLSYPRIGSDDFINLIFKLAGEQKISVRNLSEQGIKNDLALAKQLIPLRQEASLVWRWLSDTIGQANSEAWEGVMSYYGALSQAADRDPDLAAALKPADDFMALGPQESDEAEEPTEVTE